MRTEINWLDEELNRERRERENPQEKSFWCRIGRYFQRKPVSERDVRAAERRDEIVNRLERPFVVSSGSTVKDGINSTIDAQKIAIAAIIGEATRHEKET